MRILITNCSASRAIQPVATMDKLGIVASQGEAMDLWANMVFDTRAVQFPPSEIYRGGGFQESLALAAEHALSEIHIVTGGQGLIRSDTPIVPYDFSASNKEQDYVQKHISGPFIGHQWWAEINERRDGIRNPVTQLIMRDDVDEVLICCTKIFTKYIERDLLSLPQEHWHKVRVFIAASSIGSFAKQLRPMLCPYSRETIAHLPGNRNNGPQRAVINYIQQVEAGLDPKTAPDYFQQDTKQEAGPSDVEWTQMIKDHLNANSSLLDLSADEAYAHAKGQLGKCGGSLFFKGVFREITGCVYSAGADDAALDILGSLGLEHVDNIQEDKDEEATLMLLAVLAAALKQAESKAQLTTAQIVTWAKGYCTKRKLPLPGYMESSAKLARVVGNNYTVVGLREVTSPTVSGKRYTLAD